jgi:acetolactate synthase-1/2/3 large subunit
VFCITGEGLVQMCIQKPQPARSTTRRIKTARSTNATWHAPRQERNIPAATAAATDALLHFTAEAYGHVGTLIEKPGRCGMLRGSAQAWRPHRASMDFRTDPTEKRVSDGTRHH